VVSLGSSFVVKLLRKCLIHRGGLPKSHLAATVIREVKMPFYEHIIMSRPDISTQQVDTIIEDMTKLITDAGGKVTKTEYWGLRNLAYRIKKQRKAHYSFLNIEAPAAALQEVERQHSLSEEILRYISIKVEELDDEPSVILSRREKEEKKAKARAEYTRENEEFTEESEEA
jgi:small subunit ribosomal protein S6